MVNQLKMLASSLLFCCPIMFFGCKSNSGSAAAFTASPPAKHIDVEKDKPPQHKMIKIGIDVCDTYLLFYRECLDELPASQREVASSSLYQTAHIWKKISSTPEGKKGLLKTCQVVLAGAKRATAHWGCHKSSLLPH